MLESVILSILLLKCSYRNVGERAYHGISIGFQIGVLKLSASTDLFWRAFYEA